MTNQVNPMTSSDATSDDKLWALLSYVVWIIIPIVVLLMEDKKNRPYIKMHVYQALAFAVLATIVTVITSFFIIGVCIGPLCWLVSIYWGIQAYQGKEVNIPVISNFVKNQGWGN